MKRYTEILRRVVTQGNQPSPFNGLYPTRIHFRIGREGTISRYIGKPTLEAWSDFLQKRKGATNWMYQEFDKRNLLRAGDSDRDPFFGTFFRYYYLIPVILRANLTDYDWRWFQPFRTKYGTMYSSSQYGLSRPQTYDLVRKLFQDEKFKYDVTSFPNQIYIKNLLDKQKVLNRARQERAGLPPVVPPHEPPVNEITAKRRAELILAFEEVKQHEL